MSSRLHQPTGLQMLRELIAKESNEKIKSLKKSVSKLLALHRERIEHCKEVLQEIDKTMEESYLIICILLPLEQQTGLYLREPKL